MSAPATVVGRTIPDEPDLPRMRAERHARLQEQLEVSGLDGLVLLGTNNVNYATGAQAPACDSGRAALFRSVAVVVRGEKVPHVFTMYEDGVPAEMPWHPPLFPDLAGFSPAAMRDLLPAGSRIGVDDQTWPMITGWTDVEFVSAAPVLGPAKLCKTVDELACIRRAQQINEEAMRDVQPRLRPGIRQTELSAVFLRRVFELGATSNTIDPIWQAMPHSHAEGPWTVHGDVAFPTPTTDRFLRDGEVIWVDTGISYEGYASDFGRTWIVGVDPVPTPAQQRQFELWRQVMDAVLARCKPGATGLELGRAAMAAAAPAGSGPARKPWIEHFYLAHGVGTDSAEMPLIGTDLGSAFDEALVLTPGMVLVLEPVIWEDGAGGYRSEDIFAITDDGWVALSDYPFDPFADRR